MTSEAPKAVVIESAHKLWNCGPCAELATTSAEADPAVTYAAVTLSNGHHFVWLSEVREHEGIHYLDIGDRPSPEPGGRPGPKPEPEPEPEPEPAEVGIARFLELVKEVPPTELANFIGNVNRHIETRYGVDLPWLDYVTGNLQTRAQARCGNCHHPRASHLDGDVSLCAVSGCTCRGFIERSTKREKA